MPRNTYSDGQPFSTVALNSQKQGHNDTGVITGGELTLGTGDLDVDVSTVSYAIEGETYANSADTVTVSSGDSEDRFDLVVATDEENVEVVEGDPSDVVDQIQIDDDDVVVVEEGGVPNAPEIPEGAVLLGGVYVGEGDTELISSSLFDDYKTPVGLKKIGFVQESEPTVTDGSTWFDPEDGNLYVGVDGEWELVFAEEQVNEAAFAYNVVGLL